MNSRTTKKYMKSLFGCHGKFNSQKDRCRISDTDRYTRNNTTNESLCENRIINSVLD